MNGNSWTCQVSDQSYSFLLTFIVRKEIDVDVVIVIVVIVIVVIVDVVIVVSRLVPVNLHFLWRIFTRMS